MAERKNVVVVAAQRAPLGKSGWKAGQKKGIFYWASPQDFGAQIVTNIYNKTNSMAKGQLKPEEIEAVAYGCSGQYGAQSGDIARISAVSTLTYKVCPA